MIQKKSQHIQLRVTPEQKQIIKSLSEAEDMEMSAWILAKLLGSKTVIFRQLVNQLEKEESTSYQFAAINDFLNDLNSHEFTLALCDEPPARLDDFKVNYLIGMISHRANQLGVNVPDWTKNYKPLEKPYFGTSLKSLRQYLLFNSLPAFKIRNIFVDSSVGDRC